MKYMFYSDPGHGWLRVKMQEIIDLGIQHKITIYSYVSANGKYAYLEEDCDAGTFIEAKYGKNPPKEAFGESRSSKYSRIRNLPGYRQPIVHYPGHNPSIPAIPPHQPSTTP